MDVSSKGITSDVIKYFMYVVQVISHSENIVLGTDVKTLFKRYPGYQV